MPNIDVRCTVDNCHFWGQGNTCTASEILITTNAVDQRYPGSIDASDLTTILNEVGETPAQSAVETSCKTFRGR